MSNERVLVETILKVIESEVSNLLKAKLLYLTLFIMKGSRRITLLFFRAFLLCMIFTASLFSIIIYNVTKLSIQLDLFNIVTLSISLITFFAMVWNLREKRWVEIFQIQEKIYEIRDMRRD